MRRLALALAAFSLAASSAAPLLAAGREGEDRLRRRVKRFYVLNYLDRHGEMWEMFSADLRERLGGDRQDYVKTARRSGFELYGSRIEDLVVKGELASVHVALEAVLAGSFELDSRRHRMLWRFEDGDWRYAGSVDVTNVDDEGEATVEAVTPQPPSRAQAPEVEPEELLPRRIRAEPPSPSSRDEPEARRAGPGERWDLVAVPPPGTSPRPSAETVPAPVAGVEPAAPPEARAAAEVPGGPSAPTVRPEEGERPLLPPERAVAPRAHQAVTSPADQASDEGSRLVRRAVDATLPRRVRALNALRALSDPRLAPVMAEALPHAPASTAELFLSEIARHGDWEQAGAVERALDRPEPSVRGAAARALGALGDESRLDRLRRLFSEEVDDAVRGEALRALAALGEGEQVWAAALSDVEAGPHALVAAAQVAGASGWRSLAEPLLELAARTRHVSVAAAALVAAGRLGDEAALERLEDVAERRLRLPAQASSDFDPVLEARRGLSLGGAAGSGDALAELMLTRGMRADSEDVVLVASTGDLDALLSLLAHPSAAIRRRTAELVGRVVEEADEVVTALGAVESALLEERDRVALDALIAARDRLRAASSS